MAAITLAFFAIVGIVVGCIGGLIVAYIYAVPTMGSVLIGGGIGWGLGLLVALILLERNPPPRT